MESEKKCHEKIQACYFKVTVGAIYYHYRDPTKFYKVIDIGLDEATENPVVIYKAMYGNEITWVRAVDVFCSLVEHNGESTTRFIEAK